MLALELASCYLGKTMVRDNIVRGNLDLIVTVTIQFCYHQPASSERDDLVKFRVLCMRSGHCPGQLQGARIIKAI